MKTDIGVVTESKMGFSANITKKRDVNLVERVSIEMHRKLKMKIGLGITVEIEMVKDLKE